TAPSVSGSRGDTPYNRPDANRVVNIAMIRPANTPTPATRNPSATTDRATRCESAPSAILMPISRVRCDTRYDVTPYAPISARDRASAANIPTSVMLNRRSATRPDSICSIVSAFEMGCAGSISRTTRRTWPTNDNGSPAVRITTSCRYDAVWENRKHAYAPTDLSQH